VYHTVLLWFGVADGLSGVSAGSLPEQRERS
jgi:hypothetical protein